MISTNATYYEKINLIQPELFIISHMYALSIL